MTTLRKSKSRKMRKLEAIQRTLSDITRRLDTSPSSAWTVDQWTDAFWCACITARGLAGLAGYSPIEVAMLVLADQTGFTGMIGEAEVQRIVRAAMRGQSYW